MLEGDVKQKVRDKLHKIGFLRIKSRTAGRGSKRGSCESTHHAMSRPARAEEMCGSGTEGKQFV